VNQSKVTALHNGGDTYRVHPGPLEYHDVGSYCSNGNTIRSTAVTPLCANTPLCNAGFHPTTTNTQDVVADDCNSLVQASQAAVGAISVPIPVCDTPLCDKLQNETIDPSPHRNRPSTSFDVDLDGCEMVRYGEIRFSDESYRRAGTTLPHRLLQRSAEIRVTNSSIIKSRSELGSRAIGNRLVRIILAMFILFRIQ